MSADRHPRSPVESYVNWLDAVLKVLVDPIIVPLITSNRDVKHDIKPIS
ncbi:hypothetical protein GCM10017562_72900 [Streptomyces roseofulvus]